MPEPAQEILLHRDSLLGKKVQLNGKVYEVVVANSGDATCISFRNRETDLFLRHKNGRLIESDADDSPKFFPLDSSFVPEEVASGVGEKGFVAHCSNPGMEKHYICSVDVDAAVVNPDLVPFAFTYFSSSQQTSHARGTTGEQHLRFVPRTKEFVVNGRNILGARLFFGKTRYLVVPANTGDASCVSLKNATYNLYLRHQNGKIRETTSQDNPKFFPLDSSFMPVACGEGFVLRCSNPGFENHYICKVDDESFIVNPGLLPHIFPCPSLPWRTFAEDIPSDFAKIQFEAASALATSEFCAPEDYGRDADSLARYDDPVWHYVTYGVNAGLSNDPVSEAIVLLHILSPASVTMENCTALQDYLANHASGYTAQGLGEKLYEILKVARIDVLPKGTKEKPLQLNLEGSDPSVSYPDWLHSPEGNGSMIESTALETATTYTCEQSGDVTFVFRCRDLRKYDEPDVRISLWTQYQHVEIVQNGEVVKQLDAPFLAMHDKTTEYTLKVNNKDRIEVKAQWAPCFHARTALFEMLKTIDASVSQIYNSL